MPHNQAPIANAGKDQIIRLPGDSALLDGTLSTDADGMINKWQWTKIAGPALFTIPDNKVAKTIVKNLAPGIYQFQLKVTDDQGAWAVDTMMITVNPASSTNQAPIANAGNDTVIVLSGNTANLDGRLSYDPDNNISSYLWTKVSGPSSFGIADAKVVISQANDLIEGVYLFELKVTDAGALFDLDTIQVTVVKITLPPLCNDCKIVFVSDRDGNSEIYTCNPDGSHITRLTYNNDYDDEPIWSPDHSKISFVKYWPGNSEIFIMNADGSNVRQLTFSGNYSHNPSWSPDGLKIAFSAINNGSYNIWNIDAAGGTPTLLFEHPGWEDQASWSPDGTKMVFFSDWRAYDFVYDIFTINPDGSNFNALTGNIIDHLDYLNPSWSPDGTKFALAIRKTVGIDQYDTQIGVMNADGSGLTSIISNAQWWTKTSWAPDGTKIIYTSLTGTWQDVSWVSVNGSASGTIVTNGWNADW
jgi:Tol biopolymer transport system component